MSKVIFSGIQPSGNLHLGNYIGAIKQWVGLQDSSSYDLDLFFSIVDLHAITVPQDPKVLKEKVYEVAAIYLACGLNPAKAHIFIQSENPNHPYLAWIFDCIIPFGQMNRMTQFKEKSEKQKEGTTVGLFNYPALMAADILLYGTDEVPVGEDQIQHIELTRDTAERFNHIYQTNLFKLPKPSIDKHAARIMSLQNPLSKMSKSDQNPLGAINLLDDEQTIREKIKKAVTDSGSEILYSDDKPAINNLLVIYSRLSNKKVPELEEEYQNATYAKFKEDLANVVVEALNPIRTKSLELLNDKSYLNKILDEGRDYAVSKSLQVVKKVNEVVGLGRD